MGGSCRGPTHTTVPAAPAWRRWVTICGKPNGANRKYPSQAWSWPLSLGASNDGELLRTFQRRYRCYPFGCGPGALREGDKGDRMFVVKSGELTVIGDGNHVF